MSPQRAAAYSLSLPQQRDDRVPVSLVEFRASTHSTIAHPTAALRFLQHTQVAAAGLSHSRGTVLGQGEEFLREFSRSKAYPGSKLRDWRIEGKRAGAKKVWRPQSLKSGE